MSFTRGLERIKDILVRMSILTKESVDRVNALFSTTDDLESRKKIWNEVNEISMILDNLRKELVMEVLMFIARKQPLGLELREAQIIISIAYDMYRISRYCREIARIDMLMMPESNISKIRNMHAVFDLARKAVEAVIKDLEELKPVNKDIISDIDNAVDEEYGKVLREITMNENVNREIACKALLMRHIEGIVDHVDYIEQYLSELQS
ncbi:MAG: phosphate uptake regulator PhoU [Desulfurococcaceae archaeon]